MAPSDYAPRDTRAPSSFPFRVFVLAALAVLSFSAVSSAAFELRSLNVSITLNNDGSAHVGESVLLFITTNSSIVLYEQSSKYNDLSSWSTRTEIPDVSTHVDWGQVDIRNLQVNPEKKFNCNLPANTCYGRLQIDYNIYPLPANNTGAQMMVSYKPRTTKYIFQPGILTFPHSNTGDILLPSGVSLRIAVPENAVRISLSPMPSNLAGQDSAFKYDSSSNATYYLGDQRVFVWTDPTLPKFSLSYENEATLESEVLQFFASIQAQVFSVVFSTDGAAYLLAVAIILLSIFWLNSLGLK